MNAFLSLLLFIITVIIMKWEPIIIHSRKLQTRSRLQVNAALPQTERSTDRSLFVIMLIQRFRQIQRLQQFRVASPASGAAAAARAALRIPPSVNRTLLSCVQTTVGQPAVGTVDVTCARMLMHATAHRGCTDTGRVPSLTVDSLTNISCRTADSVLRLAFQSDALLTELSGPS